MSSAKFVPLNQNDDYKLDNLQHGQHGIPQYTDPATYQQQMYQQQAYQQQMYHQQSPPPAWQPAAYDTGKLGHHTHTTYVSTPTAYSPDDQSKSQDLFLWFAH